MILHYLQVRDFGSLPAVWTLCHPVRTLICPQFQPSGRRTIPSRRLTDQRIIRPDNVDFRLDTHLHRKAFILACIRLDVSAARPDDVQWSINFRFPFQVQIREDWCNRPDDVDSSPDELIHKARIAIQIQPSGPKSAWSGRAFNKYGNCVFNFNRPDTYLSCSGRELNIYGNCVLKINHPDDSASTSRRGSQTGKIFSENLRIFYRTVVRPDSVRTYHSSRPFWTLSL